MPAPQAIGWKSISYQTPNRNCRSSATLPKSKPALLHPRNPHQGRYDMEALCKACPELRSYLKSNPKDETTIDFSDSKAVLYLNKALLAHYYQTPNWQIPEGYLCPPIPGRADYIHHIADLGDRAIHRSMPQWPRPGQPTSVNGTISTRAGRLAVTVH